MNQKRPTWLNHMVEANTRFRTHVDLERIPVERAPCPYAVVTCMDPRMNLDCIGIPPFTDAGEARSQVRIIRTIGGMSESRSLVIGIFLAGIKELAILMHSDCGCCLAHSRIGTMIDNMGESLNERQLARFRDEIGEPFEGRLAAWLKAFSDPGEAVRKEVAFVRSLPFVPEKMPVHGIVYELSSAKIEVVVDGYESTGSRRER